MTAMVRLGDDVARAIADPRSCAEWDDFHQMLVGVRRDTPFARAEIDDCHPFWVASKYDDIQSVSRQNTQFLSGLGGLQNCEASVQEGATVFPHWRDNSNANTAWTRDVAVVTG